MQVLKAVGRFDGELVGRLLGAFDGTDARFRAGIVGRRIRRKPAWLKRWLITGKFGGCIARKRTGERGWIVTGLFIGGIVSTSTTVTVLTTNDGSSDGRKLGTLEGITLGSPEGNRVGSSDGSNEGSIDGNILGSSDGRREGSFEGYILGKNTAFVRPWKQTCSS
eukprot:scaffold1897_cov236-Chaetoceros_neogracile.AAC.3